MNTKLHVYNTLSKRKELFEPLNQGRVGMYVCGPTVYGDSHLGHARPAIIFDTLFRYLTYLGYKVRYVRNITDVGHLVADADDGEDKIAKQAKLNQLEPMEVVQKYTNSYHRNMQQLNTLPPSIEPHASGHIIEQMEMVEQILKAGFAYESNGSVYFDVAKYSETNDYGKLSGRVLAELQANTRELEGQSEKRNSFDFALWKKAAPEHIMRWHSRWSDGFPGWHLECSVMSTKYLGEQFDIHGGGLDLQFPHHECEIAQSKAANGKDAVKYWMHNNMITIDGQKMGKSLGNFITLDEMFAGTHRLLEQPYHPIVVRFFMLQAHYRSPLDFSNEALQSSERGLKRLITAVNTLSNLSASDSSSVDIQQLKEKSLAAINDDLNSPILIAHLFDGVKMINNIKAGNATISADDLTELKAFYHTFVFDILGLQDVFGESKETGKLAEVVDTFLTLRLEAKKQKNFALADDIRKLLGNLGFEIKDKKDGFEWELK